MRHAICACEPQQICAGEIGQWKFVYTPTQTLPKGTSIRFNIHSEEGYYDWEIPQTNLKLKENLIFLELPNNKKVQGSPVKGDTSLFEFKLPLTINEEQPFSIVIGSATKKEALKQGNRAQLYTQRKKPFSLSYDIKGKNNFSEPDFFFVDIRGNVLQNLNIITPSFVMRNKRFDVIIRFEDEFGNLTNNAPEGTLIELSYENLRENLSWKLFIPETGFLTLPNLYFNEPGTYRLRLTNLKTKQVYFSNPIKCFFDNENQLLWGLLHGESERVDSEENIDACLRHFRDDRGMQFFATSSFDAETETSSDIWKKIDIHISEFNEDDRFTTFLGFQWVGEPKMEGMRLFIHHKDHKPILRRKEAKYNSLKKIYKSFQPKDLLSIPTFTMGSKTTFNFEEFHPLFERVVEIYNAWGSSECTVKEKNLKPIATEKKKATEAAEGSIIRALNHNCRFGFVAGGLDDRGAYSSFYDSDQKQYSPGLTAIIAKDQTRDALFTALYNRSCYATTGPQILLGFNIAEMPMGSELDTIKKPGLMYNRHISGFVIGTLPLKEITLIRCGKVFKSFHPQGNEWEFTLDDSEAIDSIALHSKNSKTPFLYYYLRVEQEDGEIAWSSPIWIDYHTEKTLSSPQKPKKK
ncbi:MAG: DUF3604 domain-containing protein [Parachlamydiales bacterium]|nr:DUF3604 domain-containing protein [Parachlamydiales bacterium]